MNSSADPAAEPRSGRIVIDWADSGNPGDPLLRFSWSIRAEPLMDDERLAMLLSEISEVL